MGSLLCSYAICGDFFPLDSSLRERGLPWVSQKNHFSRSRIIQRLQCLILNGVDIWKHFFILSSHCTKRGQENILTESGTPDSVLCSGTLQNHVWTHCIAWTFKCALQLMLLQKWRQHAAHHGSVLTPSFKRALWHTYSKGIHQGMPAAAPVHCGCCKYTKGLLSKRHEVQTGNNKCPQAEKDILLFIEKGPPSPVVLVIYYSLTC